MARPHDARKRRGMHVRQRETAHVTFLAHFVQSRLYDHPHIIQGFLCGSEESPLTAPSGSHVGTPYHLPEYAFSEGFALQTFFLNWHDGTLRPSYGNMYVFQSSVDRVVQNLAVFFRVVKAVDHISCTSPAKDLGRTFNFDLAS